MKVRIEFAEQQDGEDAESFYDVVEFSTCYAGDTEGWAYAVLDFLRPSPIRASIILLHALSELEMPESLGVWGEKHRRDFELLRDSISEMLSNSTSEPLESP